MTRSKTWAILDKNRVNAWLDNTFGNSSMVSEWKETSDSLNLPLVFFWRHFVLRCRGNKQLFNHFIISVPGVVAVCKRSGSIWISS